MSTILRRRRASARTSATNCSEGGSTIRLAATTATATAAAPTRRTTSVPKCAPTGPQIVRSWLHSGGRARPRPMSFRTRCRGSTRDEAPTGFHGRRGISKAYAEPAQGMNGQMRLKKLDASVTKVRAVGMSSSPNPSPKNAAMMSLKYGLV